MNRWKISTLILAPLLFAAVAGDVLFYPMVMRPLLLPGDEALVPAVQQRMATQLRTTVEQVRRLTFPIVTHMSDRTCIELRAAARVGNDYLECRDRQGKLVDGRLGGHGSPM